MNRITAIKQIYAAHPGAFFVLSNGLTSREAAHFMPLDNCFYLLHAMGEALSVGIGMAHCYTDLDIVVIDGDGNALMGLASWSLMPVDRLKYYVLQNRIYETTGGQALSELPFIPHWATIIEIDPGRSETNNPPPPEKIWNQTRRWLKNSGTTTIISEYEYY